MAYSVTKNIKQPAHTREDTKLGRVVVGLNRAKVVDSLGWKRYTRSVRLLLTV